MKNCGHSSFSISESNFRKRSPLCGTVPGERSFLMRPLTGRASAPGSSALPQEDLLRRHPKFNFYIEQKGYNSDNKKRIIALEGKGLQTTSPFSSPFFDVITFALFITRLTCCYCWMLPITFNAFPLLSPLTFIIPRTRENRRSGFGRRKKRIFFHRHQYFNRSIFPNRQINNKKKKRMKRKMILLLIRNNECIHWCFESTPYALPRPNASGPRDNGGCVGEGGLRELPTLSFFIFKSRDGVNSVIMRQRRFYSNCSFPLKTMPRIVYHFFQSNWDLQMAEIFVLTFFLLSDSSERFSHSKTP